MFAILEGERVDDQLRQTWKAADITAQAILEGRHRIVGTTCGVIPALHRRGRETNIHAGREASKGPMIEKRRRAPRSRLFGSVGVFKRVSQCAVPAASLVEVEITNPRGDWLSTTSACD